jgi:hypothetical protein
MAIFCMMSQTGAREDIYCQYELGVDAKGAKQYCRVAVVATVDCNHYQGFSYLGLPLQYGCNLEQV